MAEITMTERQLDQLAGKLGDLSETLSDDEQALLFTLLAVGARAMMGDKVEGFAHFTPAPRTKPRPDGTSVEIVVPDRPVPNDDRSPWQGVLAGLLVGF